ncbi:hypothetical protein CLOP_g19561 [Closterium sp. NIES-67]|nr:hypothetical protein CLOP_g19561 [Closterium sp. NIES-67]
MDNNRLNQTFPAGLSGSRSLEIIHLSNNTIQGRLPPTLDLPQLQDLSMNNCSMPPQPLPSLAGLPALCYLDLSRNNFRGSVPLSLFSSHPELVTLNLARNHLSSYLPPVVASANLTRLHSIILSDNNLTGRVPLLDTLLPSPPSPLFDNHFTWASAALLSNENVTLQLYGNDLCVPYRPEVTAACSPPRDIMQYQPPPICDHLSCPSLYSPSPPLLALSNVCTCVSPLEVELKLTHHSMQCSMTSLADLLIKRIAESLGKNGIGISTGQIAIVSADGSILSPSSITTTIRFFPPPSSSSLSSSFASSSPPRCFPPSSSSSSSYSPPPLSPYSSPTSSSSSSSPPSSPPPPSSPSSSYGTYSFTPGATISTTASTTARVSSDTSTTASSSGSSSSSSSATTSSSGSGSSAWQPADQPQEIREAFVWHKVMLGPDFGPFTVEAIAPSGGGGMSTAAIVGIVVGGVVALALIVLLLRKDLWTPEDYKAIEGLQRLGVHRCKLKEIEDATQGFKTLLGEGGYGQVYRGVLASGDVVAVKRAKGHVKLCGTEFRNEITLLSAVRHRNLVQLKGFCVEEGEQLLVYEFIEKGTLEDMLRRT